jgi:hypothetical protein
MEDQHQDATPVEEQQAPEELPELVFTIDAGERTVCPMPRIDPTNEPVDYHGQIVGGDESPAKSFR